MKLTNNLSTSSRMNMYKNQEFDTFQWVLVRDGLEQGLDVSVYAKKIHNWPLMRVAMQLLKVNANLEHCIVNDKLDVDKLLAEYNRQIRLGKVKSLSFKELQMLRMEPYKKERKKKKKESE